MNPTPPTIDAPERRALEPFREALAQCEGAPDDMAIGDASYSTVTVGDIKRLLALLAASSGERGAETGWLIEESFGNGTHWIALSGGPQNWTKLAELDDHELFKADTPFRRTKDSNEALRFARKEDAEALIAKFDIHLWHAVATEHQWIPAPRDRGGTQGMRWWQETVSAPAALALMTIMVMLFVVGVLIGASL